MPARAKLRTHELSLTCPHPPPARRFVKYNDLLRGFGAALEGCKGNGYVTTIHAINSAIVKASKLTVAAKVYRGVAGGVLPERFWVEDEQGVRGGVERAFLSTTYERDVAMQYASVDGKPSIVFEIQSERRAVAYTCLHAHHSHQPP